MKIQLLILILIPFSVIAQVAEIPLSDSTSVDSLSFIPEMEIVAKRILTKRKVDGLEFVVDCSPLQHLNAWEILGRTPNVQANGDQLSVRGGGNVIILINGRRSYLTIDQLKNLLESTSGSDIYSIEVMTNPPAKYDAQGEAVINIKMKINRDLGYKGSVFTRHDQATYAMERVGTNHAYATEKMQLTGNYAFNSGARVRYNLDEMTFQSNNTKWVSDMKRKTEIPQQHIFGLNSNFVLDSLTNLRVGVDGQFTPESRGNYFIPTKIFNQNTGIAESLYTTDNRRILQNRAVNSYLALDRSWEKSNLQWSSNYSFLSINDDQDVRTYRLFSGQIPSYERFTNLAAQKIHVATSQLDYQVQFSKWELEAGVKYSFVTNDNQLSFSNEVNSVLLEDTSKSTNFLYRENIGALYVSASYKLGKWLFKGGLRGEFTGIQTLANHGFGKNSSTKLNLFPSFYALYEVKENMQIGINYTRRINRPDYAFLNPAKSYYNAYSYFKGDPFLKATIIDQLSFFVTVNDWNIEMAYGHHQHPSMEILFQNQATFETVYQFTNIKNANELYVSLYKDFNLTKWWKFTTVVVGQYMDNSFQGVDGLLYRQSIFFGYANLHSHWMLDKKKTMSLTLGYRINSKSIQGPFVISASHNLFLQWNKKWLDNRLETGLFINDIFRTDRSIITAKCADQDQRFTDYRDLQSIQINLKWNFGNQRVKDAKKQEKTAEQNRL